MAPGDGIKPRLPFKHADHALFRSKQNGRAQSLVLLRPLRRRHGEARMPMPALLAYLSPTEILAKRDIVVIQILDTEFADAI